MEDGLWRVGGERVKVADWKPRSRDKTRLSRVSFVPFSARVPQKLSKGGGLNERKKSGGGRPCVESLVVETAYMMPAAHCLYAHQTHVATSFITTETEKYIVGQVHRTATFPPLSLRVIWPRHFHLDDVFCIFQPFVDTVNDACGTRQLLTCCEAGGGGCVLEVFHRDRGCLGGRCVIVGNSQHEELNEHASEGRKGGCLCGFCPLVQFILSHPE